MADIPEIQKVIKAAQNHDLQALQDCIDGLSFEELKVVDIQDPLTGHTPLHAAIASNQASRPSNTPGGADKTVGDENYSAEETVKFLLENGAIWNQLDRNDETPGCIANRLGLKTLYQLMVGAGVRAEMLLNRLDEYDELEEADQADQVGDEMEAQLGNVGDTNNSELTTYEMNGQNEEQGSSSKRPDNTQVGSATYLSSTLSHADGKLLDSEKNGVMMDWESKIMAQSADLILPSAQLKVLNIGFGMGIIDTYIHQHTNTPLEHHIVEAHPDVLRDMRAAGWMDKPGVVVHEGGWQDVCLKLINEGQTFDGIYYDTFAESYHDFKDFFSEHVLSMLEQEGRWSFFNGMGADRQISYDVYQKIVEMDLFEAGFDVEWKEIALPDLSGEWEGVKRKYWNVESYRLPSCKFMD